MSNILGGGSNAKQQRVAASLHFQTSQAGSVIPLVYGTTKLAPNLLDYDDFTASAAKSNKGKGGGLTGKGSGQETYSASVILGVCQGPIAGWGAVWWNKSISLLVSLTGLSTTNLGADGQPADPFWVANHPAKALGYSGTANVTLDNYQLGQSAALPNFNFEVIGIESGSGVNGYDANAAAIVTDFLTNPRYGANFPAANLDSLTTWSEYCSAAGIFLSPLLDTQQQAQQSLGDIVKITNSAIVWSGGLLKILPYGDQPLSVTYWTVAIGGTTGGLDTLSITFSSASLPGSPLTVSYQAQPANVNADTVYVASVGDGLCVAIQDTGALAQVGIYAGVTPSGILIGALDTAVLPLTITASAVQAPGSDGAETFTIAGPLGSFTYTPDATPIYSFGEDDFIVQESSVGVYLGVNPGGPALRMGATPITEGFSDDPVHIARSTPADANNWIEVECLDRGNSYNPNPVIAFDQGSIDLYGVRKDTSLKARAIVDPYLTAPIVAQLLLQRSLYYRNTYTFQLGWKYCLLEPMDLVQISDARLGASAITVRITAIAEDEEGTLAITAEDWFGTPGPVLYPVTNPPPVPPGISSLGSGAGTAMPRPSQGSAPTTPVYNAAAPSVNPPFILEPTSQLLTAQGLVSPEIIIGLSGGPDGAYSPIWGGAQVYVSLDGSSYGLQGTFTGRSTMGVSTADLSPTGGTLSVDLSESNGALASVGADAAAAGVSLCALRYPGGQIEFLTFATATLTGINQYDLTGLNRGLYGTYAINQPAGAQFLYLATGNYYVQTLPTQYVGRILFFEFPSFNITAGGQQTLAETVAYEYTPQGAQVDPTSFPVAVGCDFAMQIEVRSSTVRTEQLLPIESA
jgi:hypothetical protein